MVTIKDVAKLANVPEKTVMRALAGQIMGKRRDAQERAERVFAAAEKLGYRPSAIAASLRKGQTKNIGLLVGHITNRYYGALTETVMQECTRLGYHLSIELPGDNFKQTIDCIDHLLRTRVDGLFFAMTANPDLQSYLNKLVKTGFPVVMLHTNELGIASVIRDYSAVLPETIQSLNRPQIKKVVLAQWNRHSSHDDITAEAFLRECSLAQLHGSVLKMDALTDIALLVSERPDAIICDAPYCLKYFCTVKPEDYKPLIVGAYDEWNFVERPAELSGIIMMPSELQICTAVRKLIGMVQKNTFDEPDVFHGEYFPPERFAEIPVKDLTARHHLPY